jgi:branched-chain amino acid transport system substrate-binding protein
MKSKRYVVLVLLTVLALTLSMGLAKAQDAKVIKIASQTPLSGPQSALGSSMSNAVALAVEQLSGPLTEMGYTVEHVPFDDQATPDVGVANAQNFVQDPAILAVIGHLNSGVAIPSSEVYNQYNLVMVSPANTNPTVTDRGLQVVNRICGRDDLQGPTGARFLAELGTVSSVYVVHDTTAYGEGLATFFRAEAEALGLTVLGFEGTTEASNFDGIITPILALNPDAIYFGGIYSQTGIFISQARAAQYAGIFMGGDGFDSSEFAQLAGEAGVGTYYTSVAAPASNFPDAAKFVEDYKAKFGEDPQPFAAQAYDSTALVLKAIEKAAMYAGDVPSRSLVASVVRDTTDFKGITATVTFDAIGDNVSGQYFILQVGSGDPAQWGANSIVQTINLPSPYSAFEANLMGS